VEKAKKLVESKKGFDLSKVKFEAIQDGLCLQTIHLGSFDKSNPFLLSTNFLAFSTISESTKSGILIINRQIKSFLSSLPALGSFLLVHKPSRGGTTKGWKFSIIKSGFR
ncbi:hypothetical protein ACI3RH_13385, partial [Lactococcus lactis]